jgi:hypothetical protein
MTTDAPAPTAHPTPPTAQELVNQLLDTIKEQHQLPSEAALARHIGVSAMYIWRWRRGQYGTSTSVLLPLSLHYACTLHGGPAKIAP